MSWRYTTEIPDTQTTYLWIDGRDPVLTDTFTTDPQYQMFTSPVQLVGGCSTTIPWTTIRQSTGVRPEANAGE